MIRRFIIVTFALATLCSSGLAEVVKGTVVSVEPKDGFSRIIVRLKDSSRQVVIILKSYDGKPFTPKPGAEIQMIRLEQPKPDSKK
jgi:hypothetical protein